MKKKWYQKGINFECQGSGRCCTSRGEYGYVYLTKKDREDMAKVLGLTKAQFTKDYCQKGDDVYFLKENPESPDCIFLEGNKCSVYEGRPTQCRTWPFWPENMHAKTWKKEIASYCAGVNKGRLYTAQEIENKIKEQEESEKEIFGPLIERTFS